MNCRKVRRYLFGYSRNELPAEETQMVKAHLDGCAECAREAQEVEAISLMLKQDLETLVPSADFNQRLLEKIQALPSEAVADEKRSWLSGMLREIFPSVRLRWALAGASAVLIVAFALMLSERPGTVRTDYASQREVGDDEHMLAGYQDVTDSMYQELMQRLSETPHVADRAFVIENFGFSRTRGEDGGIPVEDLYKRFIIERRSALARQGGRDNRYVLPVVSNQQVSQKADY
jgi:hypothetical protein